MSTAARMAEAVLRCHLKSLIVIAAGRLPHGYKEPPKVDALAAQELRNAVDDYTSMIRRR